MKRSLENSIIQKGTQTLEKLQCPPTKTEVDQIFKWGTYYQTPSKKIEKENILMPKSSEKPWIKTLSIFFINRDL